MFKKIISLLCCIVPMGAVAEPVVFEGADVSTNGTVYTNLPKWQSAITDNDTIVIKQGDTIGDTNIVAAENPIGVEIAGSMIVGQTSDTYATSGNLYVMNTAGVDSVFTISSVRDVSVGALLSVLDGWTLEISGGVDDSSITNASLSVGVGTNTGGVSVASNANLDLLNLKTVQINGPVTVNGLLTTQDVGSLDMGAVNVGGNIDVAVSKLDTDDGGETSGDFTLASLVIDGGATVDVAGDIDVDDVVQNNGTTTISANGAINVGGNLENSGTSMTVRNGDLVVDGTMKNDAGTLSLLNLNSWTVNGASIDGYSFVNTADFNAVVNGKTTLANGWNIAGMAPNGTFSLETQQIDLGSKNSILNGISNFKLSVTGGDLNVVTIANETSNAGMDIDVLAGTLSANYIVDGGSSMDINAKEIILSGQNVSNTQTALNVLAGAQQTVLSASESLTANALVANLGNLMLRAPNISLATVSNSGDISVASVADETGTINVVGDVTNVAGTMELSAKNISVGGMLSGVDGTVNISGSDSNGAPMSFGGIDVSGADVTIAASANNVAVTNNIQVTGGGLNFANSVKNVAVAGNVTVDGDIVMGGSDNTSANMNINSPVFALSASDKITAQNIDVTQSGYALTLVADNIYTNQVNVAGGSSVMFGNADVAPVLSVAGLMDIEQNGVVGFYSNTMNVDDLDNDGLIKAFGSEIVVASGDMDIAGLIRFEDNPTTNSGISVVQNNSFSLKTLGGDIAVNSINVASGDSLTLTSDKNISVSSSVINAGTINYVAANGVVTFANTENSGLLNVNSQSIELGAFVNKDGNADFQAPQVSASSISNAAGLTIASAESPIDLLNVTGNITNTAGVMNIYADTVNVTGLNVSGGALNLYTDTLLDVGSVYVSGNVNQGAVTGNLNLIDTPHVTADSFTVTGSVIADAGDVLYSISGPVAIGSASDNVVGGLNVAAGAITEFNVLNDNSFWAENITNSGNTTISANGITVDANIVNNAGELVLKPGSDVIVANSVNANGGTVTLTGLGIEVANDFVVNGILGQGVSDANVDIQMDDYIVDASTLRVGGISQDGELLIKSSNVHVYGDVVASGLRFAANPEINWMNIDITGNVSGNVEFIGLGKMNIGGNYTFNDNSMLNVAVLPYGTGSNSSNINYWANISLKDDATFGQVISSPDAAPLISIDGKFMSDLAIEDLGKLDSPLLENGQFGIDVFDIVDRGTAIWLLHAEQGVYDFDTDIRNLNVKFCNADGSICVPYFNDLDANNPDGLPAYVSVRDTDDDGLADSLYVVFDNQFGGPVQVFNIQPIVTRASNSTPGTRFASGVLDELVASRLENQGFFYKTPIEVVPLLFQDTLFADAGTELYNRMENYVTTRDGSALSNFSSLFESYELEQIMASMVLNEHTVFRSFEDRLVDEFIWNRNRSLNKTWFDVDYGMFYQNTVGGAHADGNRFSISGGFDWQESNTLILGLMGHVSHTESKLDRSIDLSYGTVSQAGYVDTSVSDTNVGIGGYILKTLGEKYRMHASVMIDVHAFDVTRNQTFIDAIDGSGTAFSIMSEFGLLHDILNQYIVGNIYARVGYNFGFDMTEQSNGSDYMYLQSDGYFALTPGYSVTAQKRIYPSAWFQIRPYASIGVEYDVLGVPDTAEYKFALSNKFSEYGVEFNPLWANIGGGIEMLSANGLQFGLDYRYQYNSDLQLHNIKISGSYRF
ncbi:MAG: hypothetical protein J6J82_00045 [Alphaproteobacteria bacterium]|nr:hypothetical protein [Alphaproteobacteria bacterium]